MIEVNGLTKTYREGKGVKDLSFHVESGKAFGFLGPNGAGKTTTIRLLMGFMRPDSGSAKIDGLNCWENRTETKGRVGYLPGELHFIEHLTGIEFLELMEGMHGKRHEIKRNRKKLIDALELDPKQRIRKMSKGMKQKLGIISALMLDAQVLILDEPTSGLDPLMQRTFIELILEEKKLGKTIFMSSHQFAEVEKTCDLAGIIREGELLEIQNIDLLREIERQTYEIEVENKHDAKLLRNSGLELYPLEELRFKVISSGEQELLWKSLAQVHVKGFKQRALELEDAFMDFYRGKKECGK